MMNNGRKCYSMAVYVPEAQADEFVATVSPQIPQFVGDYDHVCWQSSPGIGQFRPLEGADPAAGEHGKVCQEPERRFECVLPLDQEVLNTFINNVILPSHPYEAPVILVTETQLFGT